MKTYIGLLRGINILGSTRLLMADLKNLCTGIGLTNPVTYIQSGNVVFEYDGRSSEVEEAMRDALEREHGLSVTVLVRTPRFLEKVVERNPFQDRDVKWLHVTILGGVPREDALTAIGNVESGDDEFRIVDDVVYVYCPNGQAKTKYHNNFFESKLKLSATSRNWRTVNKLIALAADRGVKRI